MTPLAQDPPGTNGTPSDPTPTEPATTAVAATPVQPSERIAALDTLRGVAVLGILLMNILAFGLPVAAGGNPNVAGGADGPNLWYWFANQVLFEGKMRCLFSMMFGAGMLLLTERVGRAGGETAADVYYRRLIWLIVFGMLHAYLLWWGDILYWYGVIGLFLFPLRKVRASRLLIAGLILASLLIPKAWLADTELKAAAAKAEEAQAAKDAGQPLTKEQEAAIAAWEEKKADLSPPPEKIEKEIAAHRGGYVEAFKQRLPLVEMMESTYIYRYGPTDVASMMLIGMGLFKLGVFTGVRSTRFYVLLVAFGYGIGISLNVWAGLEQINADFDPARQSFWTMAAYNYGRLLVALGHIGLVMICCRREWLGFLRRRLEAVGRMPLSNYLFETVACVLVFDGYGFGLFGELQRYELLYVVFGVWAVQLLLSPIWLRYFRYGPAEWVWRALAYWQWPAIRAPRKEPDAA